MGYRIDVPNLVARRKALGVTQEQLADAVGRTPGAIGNIERGRLYPSAELVDRIAAALRCQPADLVTDERANR